MSVMALLILAAAAAAQPRFAPVKATPFAAEAATLHVGSRDVDASKIRPYRAEWKETFATPANQVIISGTWTDRVERIQWNGREALKRTVTVDRPERNIHAVTTLIVDAHTFAPLMTEESEAGKPADLHFEYHATRLRGRRRDEGSETVHDIAANLPLKAFDTLGGMTDLFPAALPLRDGYAARFPNVSATVSKEAPPRRSPGSPSA